MFIHHSTAADEKLVIAHWFLLSLNAGAINAGGFLATGRFVSHVTGFATLFGVDLAHAKVDAAIGAMAVLLFFLIGAFIAGLLIDRPIYKKDKPHFDWVMGLSAICLFTVAIAGELFQFGVFGEINHLRETYVMIALLCLACGLQNGAITSSSGSSVRTTHLTGLTTDLGLGLAKLVTFQHDDQKYVKEKRANWLRSGSIVFFAIGATLGSMMFLKVGFLGFVFPGFISLYATWHGHKAKIKAHKQVLIDE